MKIFLLFLLFSFNIFADVKESTSAKTLSNSVSKESLFAEFYNSDEIDPRKCGVNSIRLVEKWHEHGLDISNTEIWSITNKGFQYFGLVKYYQNRWQPMLVRSIDENGEEYISNDSGGWYFHAFVVDGGKVYDASFHKNPKILPIANYIQDMFVLKHDIGNRFYERRSFGLKVLEDYEVEAGSASSQINNQSGSENNICGRLKNILDENIYSCL